MAVHDERHNSEVRDTDVVVGVDGSPASKAALRWALGQARHTGARVQTVTSWEIPAYYGMGEDFPYEDFAATAGKTLSDAVQQALGNGEPDVPVVETVVAGHPAQVLIDMSAHASLLVVGSRGHGAFTGTLLGSVSAHCVQHAHCPVVVVRGRA
jgi:nucleotide-binding universal stress UspA family protein